MVEAAAVWFHFVSGRVVSLDLLCSLFFLSTGAFANYHLWVTPHSDTERYPSGEYTVQGTGTNGLPDWTAADRNIKEEDVVLWHSFGVTHVPRPEDFPVMPCEITGFTLKPDGFFEGNPSIDLAPDVNVASKLAAGCCST